MAADTRRAPRFERRQTNIADTVAALRAASGTDASGALLDFRMAGTAPFGPTALEAAEQLTTQVYALTAVLAASYEDADSAQVSGSLGGNLTDLRGSIHGQALEGLGSLASLAAFFLAQHRGAL